MMTVPNRYITATLLVLVASLWTAAGAQGPSRGQTQRYVPPPTGQPDLQGVWRVENLARYDVEAHAARPGIPASRGVVVDPPDGRIPYRPEALQKRDENFRNSRNLDPWKSADPYHKCYSPGVPRLTYLGWPFQIYQTPRYVLFSYEWMHQRRIAYYDMKGRQAAEGVPLWSGDSRARWEGNTLVVDVTNFNDLHRNSALPRQHRRGHRLSFGGSQGRRPLPRHVDRRECLGARSRAGRFADRHHRRRQGGGPRRTAGQQARPEMRPCPPARLDAVRRQPAEGRRSPRCCPSNRKSIFLDEPTRGVDVGAKAEIHRILRDLARNGVGVIVISSELPELIGVCDRVLVVREGRITGEVAGEEMTEERIMYLASIADEGPRVS